MYCLILFLIINLVYANDVLLDEQNSECAESCYSVSKPLLSYIPTIHKLLEDCEGLKAPYPQERLNKIEGELNLLELRSNQQIQSLEEKVSFYKNQCEELQNLKNPLLSKTNDCQKPMNENTPIVREKREEKFSNFTQIGSKYYYVESDKKEVWFKALHSCLSLGAHLASPQDDEELEILTKLSRNMGGEIWLDIHNLLEDHLFMSATTGKEASFLKWYREPSPPSDGENCVELISDVGLMNNKWCKTLEHYICEADVNS